MTIAEPFHIDAARMRHFHSLDHEHQGAAIKRLAATGLSDHGIASATQLSIEQIRRVLVEQKAESEITGLLLALTWLRWRTARHRSRAT